MKTKSVNLLAKGYELIDGITVPVGTSNVDLGVEGKEPVSIWHKTTTKPPISISPNPSTWLRC